MAWVTITEPMEFDSRTIYYGIRYASDDRIWLVGEGIEGESEAKRMVFNEAAADNEARVVRIWVGIENA